MKILNSLSVIIISFSILTIACSKPKYKTIDERIKETKNLFLPKYPYSVKEVLDKSPLGKTEIEKVFIYYCRQKDSLKLKAAYFLVENMTGKKYKDGKQLDKWDIFFDVVNSKPDFWKKNLPWDSKDITPIYDSVKKQIGELTEQKLNYVNDIDVITADYLVYNIDLAFRAWKNPWAKRLSFEQFCNYILPYRCREEKLEYWRGEYMNKFNWLQDSMKTSTDTWKAASFIGPPTNLIYNEAFHKYPVPIKPSNLLKSAFGLCRDITNYKVLSMRSVGIPVTIDFIPQWGNNHLDHSWNVVLDSSGKFQPMSRKMDDDNAFHRTRYQLSKVYRKTYAIQKERFEFVKQANFYVPEFFKDLNYIDVTEEYIPVSDIKIPLLFVAKEIKVVYLATFHDREWKAIDCGYIKDGKAIFNKVGRNNAYIAVLYANEKFVPASDPFILQNDGDIRFLIPNSNPQDILLTRKFRVDKTDVDWRRNLSNAKFQGANKSDFSDAIDLYKFNRMPLEYPEEIVISNKASYRYFRIMINPDTIQIVNEEGGFSVAELSFFDNNGNILVGNPISSKGVPYNTNTEDRAFDGDVLTFFEDDKFVLGEKFIGVDLGENKSAILSKINFCARNDKNHVQPGHEYELMFWYKGEFRSIKKKKSTGYEVVFNSVPSNALFWLKNLTEGKEERIFTYEHGKQVWW